MLANSMQNLVKNGSMIRAMFEEGKKMTKLYGKENVFDFSIGNPNVEPPKVLNDVIAEILKTNTSVDIHGYMNNSGYEDVREAFAKNTNKENGTNYEAKNIVMTCGAAGAINITFKTILNPLDEVIVFAPCFAEYFNYISLFDAVGVVVPCDKDSFLPDLDILKQKITKNTKAVIINSPNNPSGVVYTEEMIKNIADILSSKEKEFGTSIYLICDEPYRKIVFDNTEVVFIPKYYKNSLFIYSFSKSLSLPGERIGYIVAPSEIDDFENIIAGLNIATRIMGFVNAPSLFQKVAARCLDITVDMSVYEKNLNVLYDGLTQIGYTIKKPAGTFYMFPKSLIENDIEFCNAAKKYNLLLVPGKGFKSPGNFRIAFCTDYETCKNSLNAFEKLYKEFNN